MAVPHGAPSMSSPVPAGSPDTNSLSGSGPRRTPGNVTLSATGSSFVVYVVVVEVERGQVAESYGEVSFEFFVEEHYRRVLALVIAVYGGRDNEDLVQEAFLQAHRSWERLAGDDLRGLWVRRVALNLAVSRFRRWRVESAALLRLASRRDAQDLGLSAGSSEVWEQVRRLPARQAQVVALHYLEDRSVAEIAEILGVAEGSVRASLHQGRAALAKRLGEHFGPEGGEGG